MTLQEIIEEIQKQHKEHEVLKMLVDCVIFENEQLVKENMEYTSRLNAIRKINQTKNSKGKTEGIESLCNLEEEQ